MYPPAPVCLSPKNRSCSLFSGMKCTRGLYGRHEFPVKSRQNRRGKILPLAGGIIRPARKFLPRGAGIRIRGIDRPGPGRIERLPCGRSARLPVFGAVLREPAAAAPPTPPDPKGSNGNGCCRVSGSQKAQETLAPFSLSGAAFLPMDGAAFQTQGYHHAQSQHDEGAGKGSAPLASARPGADPDGNGTSPHRRGQCRQ